MENDQLVKGPVPELGRTDRPSEDPTLYLLPCFLRPLGELARAGFIEDRGDLFGLFLMYIDFLIY
jgi:hypothetical protein